MEIEANEMLYSKGMKELLWIKSLNDADYKQLMNDEPGVNYVIPDVIFHKRHEPTDEPGVYSAKGMARTIFSELLFSFLKF